MTGLLWLTGRSIGTTSVILQIFMIFMALSGLDDRHFQFLLMDLHQSDGQLSRGFWQNNL